MQIKYAHILPYAQLAFPLAFAGFPLYIQAPDFYATSYGISLSFIGIALFAIRLTDAFLDPVIGKLSDKFSNYRAQIIGLFGFLFALSFAGLYRPPTALEPVWFVLCVLTASLSFSGLLINLNAIGSLIAEGTDNRNKISAWREGFGIAGLLAAVILPYVIGSFTLFSTFAAGLMTLSTIYFLTWLNKKSLNTAIHAPDKFHGIASMLKQKVFSRFFTVYGLSMLASSLSAVLVVFYIRDWLQAYDKASLFLGLYFVTAILMIPFWRKIAGKIGSQQAWAVAMIVSASGIAIASLISPGETLLYLSVCIVTGMALGAELFLPPALLSDAIQRTGTESATSTLFGIYAFILKGALAVASVISFAVLDFSGFTPQSDNTDTALATLAVFYGIIPAICKLGAVYILVQHGEKNETDIQLYTSGGHHAA